MEQFFIDKFGLGWSLFVIPVFSGILMSFLIVALDTVTPEKVKGKWMLLIASVLVGAGLIFGFPKVITTPFDMVLVAFMNVIFALTFYHLKGKQMVEWLIEKTFQKVQKQVDK